MQTYDLTDLDTVKAYGGIPSTGARPQQDTRLGFLISAYSKAVGRYCDRQWIGKDPGPDFDPAATSTIAYDYLGEGFLPLGPWEAREIVSVTLDGQALDLYDPAAPRIETYSPLPRQKTLEGTYLSIQLPRREVPPQTIIGALGSFSLGDGYAGKVEVVAKWGIVGVDTDVELATCIAVLDAFRNPEGSSSFRAGEFQFNEPSSSQGNLPGAARALLSAVART